jgi:hypothetical protein
MLYPAAAFLIVVLAISPDVTHATPTSGPAFPKACGGYSVAVKPGGSPKGDGDVALRVGGRIVYRAEAFGILDVACTTLTGHPIPELLITEWTGGGSCCETIEILQLHGGPHRVLAFWGRIAEIADYTRGGSRQIFALLGNLRYFGKLCGACSPALPVVYAYDDGRYVDRSSRFPDPVLAYVKKEQQHLRESLRSGGGALEDQKGTALGILAAYIVLGRDADGWKALSQAPPAIISWLREHQAELRKIIDQVRR